MSNWCGMTMTTNQAEKSTNRRVCPSGLFNHRFWHRAAVVAPTTLDFNAQITDCAFQFLMA